MQMRSGHFPTQWILIIHEITFQARILESEKKNLKQEMNRPGREVRKKIELL